MRLCHVYMYKPDCPNKLFYYEEYLGVEVTFVNATLLVHGGSRCSLPRLSSLADLVRGAAPSAEQAVPAEVGYVLEHAAEGCWSVRGIVLYKGCWCPIVTQMSIRALLYT